MTLRCAPSALLVDGLHQRTRAVKEGAYIVDAALMCHHFSVGVDQDKGGGAVAPLPAAHRIFVFVGKRLVWGLRLQLRRPTGAFISSHTTNSKMRFSLRFNWRRDQVR